MSNQERPRVTDKQYAKSRAQALEFALPPLDISSSALNDVNDGRPLEVPHDWIVAMDAKKVAGTREKQSAEVAKALADTFSREDLSTHEKEVIQQAYHAIEVLSDEDLLQLIVEQKRHGFDTEDPAYMRFQLMRNIARGHNMAHLREALIEKVLAQKEDSDQLKLQEKLLADMQATTAASAAMLHQVLAEKAENENTITLSIPEAVNLVNSRLARLLYKAGVPEESPLGEDVKPTIGSKKVLAWAEEHIGELKDQNGNPVNTTVQLGKDATPIEQAETVNTAVEGLFSAIYYTYFGKEAQARGVQMPEELKNLLESDEVTELLTDEDLTSEHIDELRAYRVKRDLLITNMKDFTALQSNLEISAQPLQVKSENAVSLETRVEEAVAQLSIDAEEVLARAVQVFDRGELASILHGYLHQGPKNLDTLFIALHDDAHPETASRVFGQVVRNFQAMTGSSLPELPEGSRIGSFQERSRVLENYLITIKDQILNTMFINSAATNQLLENLHDTYPDAFSPGDALDAMNTELILTNARWFDSLHREVMNRELPQTPANAPERLVRALDDLRQDTSDARWHRVQNAFQIKNNFLTYGYDDQPFINSRTLLELVQPVTAFVANRFPGAIAPVDSKLSPVAEAHRQISQSYQFAIMLLENYFADKAPGLSTIVSRREQPLVWANFDNITSDLDALLEAFQTPRKDAVQAKILLGDLIDCRETYEDVMQALTFLDAHRREAPEVFEASLKAFQGLAEKKENRVEDDNTPDTPIPSQEAVLAWQPPVELTDPTHQLESALHWQKVGQLLRREAF